MSIGYDLPRGEGKISYSDDGVRTIREIKLYEISLVAIPANPKAQVTSVKSLADVEHVLRTISNPTEPEVTRQLKSIDAQLKQVLRKNSLCTCDCPDCLAGNCSDCSNEECIDENCDANLAQEELAALRAFASSLKAFVA